MQVLKIQSMNKNPRRREQKIMLRDPYGSLKRRFLVHCFVKGVKNKKENGTNSQGGRPFSHVNYSHKH